MHAYLSLDCNPTALRADTEFDTMRRHLDHLPERLGEDGVALGSDFDGAVIQEARECRRPATLIEHLRAAGYSDALLAKIAHETGCGFCHEPGTAERLVH